MPKINIINKTGVDISFRINKASSTDTLNNGKNKEKDIKTFPVLLEHRQFGKVTAKWFSTNISGQGDYVLTHLA